MQLSHRLSRRVVLTTSSRRYRGYALEEIALALEIAHLWMELWTDRGESTDSDDCIDGRGRSAIAKSRSTRDLDRQRRD